MRLALQHRVPAYRPPRAYDLIYALAEADVRTIFLAYPRHVQDASYSYSQLRDVLGPLNITREEFVAGHKATFHANFVHSYLPNVTTARAQGFERSALTR